MCQTHEYLPTNEVTLETTSPVNATPSRPMKTFIRLAGSARILRITLLTKAKASSITCNQTITELGGNEFLEVNSYLILTDVAARLMVCSRFSMASSLKNIRSHLKFSSTHYGNYFSSPFACTDYWRVVCHPLPLRAFVSTPLEDGLHQHEKNRKILVHFNNYLPYKTVYPLKNVFEMLTLSLFLKACAIPRFDTPQNHTCTS